MTTATATPSCRVIRSSRDTPPAAGSGGPDPGAAGGRSGLTGLVPLPSGWGGALGGGLAFVGGPQHFDGGQVVDLHGRVRDGGVHGHREGDEAAGAEPRPQPDPHRQRCPYTSRARRERAAATPPAATTGDTPPIRSGGPPHPPGRLRGLEDSLVADQLGGQLQGGRIGLATEQELGPMPVQDGGSPMAVAVLELGLVVPDRQQLDPLPSPGRGELGDS